jgi:hypothetical protein
MIGWLNAHSLSYRLIRDEARAIWSAVRGENTDKKAAEAGELPVDPNHPTRISLPLEVLFSQPDAKWEEAWRITGALLAAFRETVEADGATFVVAIVPPHMIVQNEYWYYADLFNSSGRAWDLWYAQNRMMALLDELGIPVINPIQDFIDMRAQTGKNPFYMRDRHFNPTGTCWFGTLLANGLMERGIVAADAAYPRDPMAVCER